jgi:hypothetical protein
MVECFILTRGRPHVNRLRWTVLKNATANIARCAAGAARDLVRSHGNRRPRVLLQHHRFLVGSPPRNNSSNCQRSRAESSI